MKRIAITGAPKVGKTPYANRLAKSLGVEAIHTDDYIPMGWSEASAHTADVMGKPTTFITEGVAVPRALRKMLEANPDRKPVDEVIIVERRGTFTVHDEKTKARAAMAKGVATVLAEIRPRLEALGVEFKTVVVESEEDSP
jgi:dephospho-CoA kinase